MDAKAPVLWSSLARVSNNVDTFSVGAAAERTKEDICVRGQLAVYLDFTILTSAS